MDYMIAGLVGAAFIVLGLATAPAEIIPWQPHSSLFNRLVARNQERLRIARLQVNPRNFTLVCLAAPPGLFLIGLALGSLVVALAAATTGFLMPQLYLNYLVHAQQKRTEAEAPHMLQIILASFSAGRNYLEALQEARNRASDRWLQDDLDYIIKQFHFDTPLEQSIAKVRQNTTGHNLGLIWDNLTICVGNRISTSKAKELFLSLSSTVQFNVQLQQEVRSRSSGQRTQIWLLAAIVPGLFFYLRLLNPDFFTVLDSTLIGKFILFPAACGLEILGVVLSFRLSRIEL